MKFLRTTMAAMFAIFALSSCDKEDIAISNAHLEVDHSIDLRCCDDASSDNLEDWYGTLLYGLVESSTSIYEVLDDEFLANMANVLYDCLEEGNEVEVCAQELNKLLQIKIFIENQHNVVFDSIRLAYELTEDEFREFIILSIEKETNQSRNHPCYLQYQQNMMNAAMDFMEDLINPITTAFAPAYLLRAWANAELDFEQCLDATY